MERKQLLEMLQQLYLVCQQINADIQAADPNSPLIYEVLQLSDFAKPRPGERKKVKAYFS